MTKDEVRMMKDEVNGNSQYLCDGCRSATWTKYDIDGKRHLACKRRGHWKAVEPSLLKQVPVKDVDTRDETIAALRAQLAAAAQWERELREALEPFAQAANDIANGTAHHFSGGLWFTDMASGLKAIVWTGGAAKHRQLSMVDLQRAARLLASADGMQGNKV